MNWNVAATGMWREKNKIVLSCYQTALFQETIFM